MKRYGIVFALVTICTALADVAPGDTDSKIEQVVTLMQGLHQQVEADGIAEQKSYHKFACWCEKTLERTKRDIATNKARAIELQADIMKLNGEIGSGGAEIAQLKKDITANEEAVREAEEVRDKQNEAYTAERVEAEQCIGALNAAIHALTGAGTDNAQFLGTTQQVKLMSVAADLSIVLKNKVVQDMDLSESDLNQIKSFVRHPDGMSALQNPFGDYAPQSTQIQGILKGMYDAFAMNLEKANGQESDESQHFQDFKRTKLDERATLQDTLERKELSHATAEQTLADNEKELSEVKKTIKDKEAFFEVTKESCKEKAKAWSARSRCRTVELQGFIEAVRILKTREGNTATAAPAEGGDEAPAEGGGETFLQLSASSVMRIRSLSKKDLLDYANNLKSTGHFDKVIAQIDTAIERLRAEEKADVAHRDRCEAAENKNKNDEEDAKALKEKHEGIAGDLDNAEKVLTKRISETKGDIKDQKKAMEDALANRNADHLEFKKVMQDAFNDKAAVLKAIKALRKFYDERDIELALAQVTPGEDGGSANVEYTIDEDVAPETEFSECGSKKGESSGVVAILEMIVEDIDNEIKQNRKAEADALALYRKLTEDNQATLESLEATLAELERRHSQNRADEADAQAAKEAAAAAEKSEQDLNGALKKECDWIRNVWDKRFDSRRNEMAALEDAKNRLAGCADGTSHMAGITGAGGGALAAADGGDGSDADSLTAAAGGGLN